MGHFYWEVYMGVLVGLIAAFGTCWGLTDPRDVVAINNLYAALGSPPLPGWVPTGGDPCAEGWQGVLCVNANITGIVLNGANLGGVLGESLGVFASIIQIDMSNNHIGGNIPSNLPITTRSFFLSGNQFTGSIPETFSSLGLLTDMSLSNNHLTGVIPDTFQQLTGLINLDLSGNNLDGQLPPSMGSLSSLTTLHLQDNRLVGTLDILQDLPLIDLNIENNLFSGPVPPKLLVIPTFRYCKGRPLTNKVPERHGMDEDDYPRDNPKHNMSLLKPYSRTENAQKEAEQEREVAAVPKHKADHNIDMPEMDENILPPPPLPALLNPFERVTARPNVAPVTFKKHISEKLSSARTFSIASLQQYTQSFSQENLLGGGMLGTVYRAELPDGKVSARGLSTTHCAPELQICQCSS